MVEALKEPHCSSNQSVLDVQIIDVDSYTAAPVSLDCSLKEPYNVYEEPLKRVPVIRIFGATKSRQRICLHVHQVWPYMYVRYDGPHDLKSIRGFGYKLGLSLNHALNIALKSNGMLFVVSVLPVKGIPFYGYHVGYQPYLKILFSSPKVVSQACSLLASGAVMGRKLDVFESHLPYTLQFLVDYNLYGMGWIKLEKVLFRSPLPDGLSSSVDDPGLITDSNVAAEHRWVPQGMPSYVCNPLPPERVSCCEIEADTCAFEIINRNQISERHIHHNINELEFKNQPERLVHSLSIIWADENKRRLYRGMGSLHSFNSQRQHNTVPSSTEGNPLTLDEISETTHNSVVSQWPNYWRAQSMLQSLLANDRTHSTKENADPNAWLSSWPTCYGADIGYTPLLAAGAASPTRFYIGNDDNLPSSQYSGVLVSHDLYHNDSRHPKSSISSQEIGPVVVDIDMIIKDKDHWGGSGTDLSGEDSTDRQHDYSSDSCTADSNGGSIDSCGLSDLEEAWMTEELLRVEKEISSANKGANVEIPQLDGADDPHEDYLDKRKHKGSKYRCGDILRKKHKARKMRPLVLHSSKGTAPKALSDYLFSSVGGKAITDPKDMCHVNSRSDIFIDIPHPEGSRIRRYQEEKYHRHNKEPMMDYRYSRQKIDQNNLSMTCASMKKHCLSAQMGVFIFRPRPPSTKSLQVSFIKCNTPEEIAQTPFFSDLQDMSNMSKMYLGSEVRVSSSSASHLRVFNPRLSRSSWSTAGSSISCGSESSPRISDCFTQVTKRRNVVWGHGLAEPLIAPSISAIAEAGIEWWVFASRPPAFLKKSTISRLESRSFIASNSDRKKHSNTVTVTPTPASRRKHDQSDIKWSAVLGSLLPPHSSRRQLGHNSVTNVPDSPTRRTTGLSGQHGSQITTNPPELMRTNMLSQLSMELLAMCRDQMPLNPQQDMITLILVCFSNDQRPQQHPHSSYNAINRSIMYQTILWTCGPATRFGRLGLPSHVEHIHQEAELEMIKDVAKRTCQLDPDILCGYEVENGSWGYLVERAQVVYGIDLVHGLSRVPNANTIRKRWQYREGEERGSGNSGKQQRVNVPGRHMLNLWKIMRSELSLTSYTFENVVLNVLDEKVPCYSHSRLSTWLLEGPAVARIRVLRHLCYRAAAVLQIIEKANIVDRAAELANVIGIDFMSVITRGSQFRVESLMARIAHPELFILSSPTREQVAHQAAAECLPLVLEPKSRYYTDPVVVLDFQSLYPSIMIAYNYCYSTCLGRIEDVAGYAPASAGDGAASRCFGFTSMAIPPGLLSEIGHQNITISPNGVMFVKSSIRKGLLARMLEEIIESRVMLKEAIGVWGKDNEVLYKKLDAWQLGLKLIANVTYGYTGASFSGRMPCVEVADSIVQTGRETLENAIRFIQSKHKTWGAEVVYGDTDSMFLHFPGKSRQAAFSLGQEIADAVTRLNPKPVKLKFEKVYQPCVLLTKKRYFGWMYTAADQAEPQLDVKGMELVRRDGCKIQQKILEGAIDVLFRENNLSLVKSFVVAQITKVLRREVPMEEFIIAKEVRLSKYLGRTMPAHAKVAKDMFHTRQLEPLHGERVPYFVISNGACDRLSDRVVLSLVLLKQPRLRLDYHYYINKQIIPALDRVFSLIGVNVHSWVEGMPRWLRSSIYDAFNGDDSESTSKTTITSASNCNQALLVPYPNPSIQIDLPFHKHIEHRSALKGPSTRSLFHFYLKRSCMLCKQTIAPISLPSKKSTAMEPFLPPGIRICERCWSDSAASSAQIGVVYRYVCGAYRNAIDECIECVGGHRADALQAVEECECVDCPNLFRRNLLSQRYQSWNKTFSMMMTC